MNDEDLPFTGSCWLAKEPFSQTQLWWGDLFESHERCCFLIPMGLDVFPKIVGTQKDPKSSRHSRGHSCFSFFAGIHCYFQAFFEISGDVLVLVGTLRQSLSVASCNQRTGTCISFRSLFFWVNLDSWQFRFQG